ncbi:MAG: hypothetical protein A2381_18585 [Bdellovibrionales bacterium RIFOXYB1_FULL_37_110]|nr:MAG: hypothetical protein A2417_01185 [Bdellovibrionales bacterium RIFOXYC1_FULL_37_79]OFZ59037.1 MAG: hypothetical protein A2381_18585 [Bdellovibrionales bacterium RIFOXYB1_FULL_37_110]OFZ65142.1 MAG: hypothetical protein A2577_04900 [Bdellovibrionales bacterium RIFOXYD1_FULL_36_51]
MKVFYIIFTLLYIFAHPNFEAVASNSCLGFLHPFLESPLKLLKNHEPLADLKNGVKMLTKAERKNHTLFISEEGLFIDSQGNPYSTDMAQIIVDDEIKSSSYAIFVISKDGELLISNFAKNNEFHHSSLVGGEEVWFAGEIKIQNGVLIEVNNYSGHYRTHERYLKKLLEFFKAKNVPLRNYTTIGYDEKVTLKFE